jgi:putative oxidoreductase
MTKTDDLALLIGRCTIGILFIPDGLDKLMYFGRFAESLARRGLPFPDAWAVAGVAADLGGSIAVLIGFEVRWAALAMIAFVAMASALSHRYWQIADPAQHRAQEAQFYKNLALIGGFLFLRVAGAGAYSVDAWRRRKAPRFPAA